MNHKTYNFLVFPVRTVLSEAILSKRGLVNTNDTSLKSNDGFCVVIPFLRIIIL